ncbi:MAG: DinB family protein [Planctomycetes bacterium]|nr:DinB family protein [Planctomycetota bacterium]
MTRSPDQGAAGPAAAAPLGAPQDGEFAAYYGNYVARAGVGDVAALLATLAAQPQALAELFTRVPADRETWSYGPGKWSFRQVVSHLVDAERVFGFRAFCFSRRDDHPLPSFEENDYVARGGADGITLADHLREFALVRASNLAFLRRLPDCAWTARGTASGNPFTVRALGWILAGHPNHHIAVTRERYAAALR